MTEHRTHSLRCSLSLPRIPLLTSLKKNRVLKTNFALHTTLPGSPKHLGCTSQRDGMSGTAGGGGGLLSGVTVLPSSTGHHSALLKGIFL